MENMVAELINIESRAKGVERKALLEKDKLPMRIKSAQAEIEKRVHDETEAKIKETWDRTLRESDEQIRKISMQAQERFAYVETEFRKNYSMWEEEIFNEVITGSDGYQPM